MTNLLYAVFQGHGTFVFLAIMLSVAVAVLRYKTARASVDHPVMHALLAGAVAAVISLTLWSTASPAQKPRICVINGDLLEPFSTDQGILNAGLFFPVGLLGVLATRQVLGTLIGGVLLTLTIETLQGALTFLGRGCDTSDLQMNSLGVLLGVLLGWIISYFEKRDVKMWRPASPRNSLVGICILSVISITWFAFITPQRVSRTVGIGQANSDQQNAAREAVENAFGDHYKIKAINFASGPDGSGTVVASFADGFAELSWPDRREFKASLDISNTGKPSGYPVGGSGKAPSDEQDSRKIARDYASAHAPWGLVGAEPLTVKVGSKAELGWMTSWRRRNADGVLMPMRLDVQVDRTGRVSQLITRNVEDPVLQAPEVTKDAAISVFLDKVNSSGEKDPDLKVDVELIAKEVDGRWRTEWLVFAQASGDAITANVDAVSGQVITFNRQPVTDDGASSPPDSID
ncbi:VanZ family protein [Streptomyces sp. NPDC059922]|uniref:VanZ family protein n=1 Tax=Streptomyces sp. NPDC059922 TaxID=3347005 RepID=UPI00364ACB9F